MSSNPMTDRLQIIQVLCQDVRASYATMAAVIGVSEQTAARRYQSLIRDSVLRCTATLDHRTLGQPEWILRITPSSAGTKLAETLARHPDMSWVSITAAEVVCLYQPQSTADNDLMLTDRIRSISLVDSLDARQVLRRFPLRTPWPDLTATLDAAARSRLDALADPTFAIDRRGDKPTRHPDELTTDDKRLIALLTRDPRAPYSTLARATNLTPARIAARISDLTHSGVLRFDLEVDERKIGLTTSAAIWAGVPLHRLEPAGHALGAISEVQYVCATTGPTGLFATIGARNPDHLYQVLTDDIARIEDLHPVDLRTDLRMLKRGRT